MPRRRGGEPVRHHAFTRLARTHAAAVAGDTLIALALAGSLFFDIDPSAARSKVALYLAFTMAPFAVVAPLIGPALDRAKGGRRFVVIGANAISGAAVPGDDRRPDTRTCCSPRPSPSWSWPRATTWPSRPSCPPWCAPTTSWWRPTRACRSCPGSWASPPRCRGSPSAVAGGEGVLLVASFVFAAAAVLGLRIPATQVAADDTSQTERQELRGGGILLAASAMGLLRASSGSSPSSSPSSCASMARPHGSSAW